MNQTLQTPFGEYTITQLFGKNPGMYSQFGMNGHNGLDIVGLSRNYCFVEGDLFDAGFDKDGYGYWCKIRDPRGYVWTYAHFASAVTIRGYVKQWTDLGQMGKTGYATGVHCHVGVKPSAPDQNNGYKGSIDPLPLIQEALKNQSTNEDDMTQEEKDMLARCDKFVTELKKGVEGFRQRSTDGALFLDAKAIGKTAKELEGTVYADSSALAALIRAAGTVQISEEESKKDKYVCVKSVRDVD